MQDIAPQPPQAHVDRATAGDTIQEQSFRRHWALPQTRWRPSGCGFAGRVGGVCTPPLAPVVAPGVGAAGRYSSWPSGSPSTTRSSSCSWGNTDNALRKRDWYGHSHPGVHRTGLPFQSRAVRWVRPRQPPLVGLTPSLSLALLIR